MEASAEHNGVGVVVQETFSATPGTVEAAPRSPPPERPEAPTPDGPKADKNNKTDKADKNDRNESNGAAGDRPRPLPHRHNQSRAKQRLVRVGGGYALPSGHEVGNPASVAYDVDGQRRHQRETKVKARGDVAAAQRKANGAYRRKQHPSPGKVWDSYMQRVETFERGLPDYARRT